MYGSQKILVSTPHHSQIKKIFSDIANDLFDSVKRFLTERFDSVDQIILENNIPEEDYIMIDDEPTLNNSTVLVLCRELRQMTRNLRERALKSLFFLRTLCMDLEICARYRWNAEQLDNVDNFINQLMNSNHVMVS